MVQLIKGSIFDSKCDLIIIPCNDFGAVSSSITEEIIAYRLPTVHRTVNLGHVNFFDNIGPFPNASVIGYAASVSALKIASSEEIIQQIMRRVRTYCWEESLTKVNMPLLGTGAGGLSAKTSYNIIKEAFENLSDISICVYTISEDMYTELVSENKQVTNVQIKNPRVFISYTGADIANRNWVKNLTYKLRGSGVDARLDMFHLKPGQDLPQWMTNELKMADKVLLICDKHYAKKADNRSGGVGWETMIIQGDMLSSQEQNKYAIILRDDDIDQSLPVYVKSKYALNWADQNKADEEFNDLLLYLFDCDIEPPLGEIPTFIKENFRK